MHVPAVGPGPVAALSYDLRSLWRARKDFDVVYMLGYGAGFACWLPRLSGSKVWINMDGLEWKRSKWKGVARFWLRAMESLGVRSADRLIFDNGALAEAILARLKPKAAWNVLAYGAPVVRRADPAVLGQFGLEPGKYDLTVCRAEPENHLLELIQAHRQSGSSRPLVVVANTDAGTKYTREVLRWADERIHLLGPIYDRQVLDPLRVHSQLYLHGHSVGGTNPALLEAMGSGALILAHDNPFNREVLADAGHYFADEPSLRARLVDLEQLDAATRAGYAERARGRILSHYSWDDLADRYLDVLEAALGVAAEDAAA